MENLYILNNNEKNLINSLIYQFSVSSPCEDLEIQRLSVLFCFNNINGKIQKFKNSKKYSY